MYSSRVSGLLPHPANNIAIAMISERMIPEVMIFLVAFIFASFNEMINYFI